MHKYGVFGFIEGRTRIVNLQNYPVNLPDMNLINYKNRPEKQTEGRTRVLMYISSPV